MAVTLDDLWPRDAVIVQRVPDDSLDWLPEDPAWRERSSAAPLPFAGRLPIICHEAAVGPAALQLLRDCGLQLSPEIIPYRDFEQMRGIVADQVRHGRRIGITYTSRRLLAPADTYVNDPEMVADLNDKANLAGLLPPEAVPLRCVVDRAELPFVLQGSLGTPPLVLKASSRLGTGAGRDVVICRSPHDLEPACSALARAERVVIEAFYAFADTWCLHFAAGDRGVVYCGAAEQICDERGAYHGNWCEQGGGPGDAAVDIGRHAAQAAWSRGYRGFMGVDIGQAEDGRWLAFDLNVRNNGSTVQALLRDAVANAWGATVTRICQGVGFSGTFDAMLERLWSFHARRELIPLLAFDTAQLDTADTTPTCRVLVTAGSRDAVTAIVAGLREAGFGLE